MKGFKKMLFGEKMPDKQDPKYKERYERDVAAGRKFAKHFALTKQPLRCRSLPTSIERCSWSSFSVLWHSSLVSTSSAS